MGNSLEGLGMCGCLIKMCNDSTQVTELLLKVTLCEVDVMAQTSKR